MSSSNTPLISFHYLIKSFPFSRRKDLKQFLLKQCRKEGKKIESLNFIFCSDEYLLRINQQFLGHDNYTDIITFELSQSDAPVSAEILVSVDRVKENAHLYSTSFTRELHRVIFHGALHLCGYKDKTLKQSQQMRSKEDELLNKYWFHVERKL